MNTRIYRTSLLLLLFILQLYLPMIYGQSFVKVTDIPYTITGESARQKLDLYIPDNEHLMPCLVWIHGGAWMAGSKNILPEEIDTLLYHGYVVASIGYRLSGEAIFPAQIHDCKAAIRFLKIHGKEYRIDSSRIAVAGASAGGHLAALIGSSAEIKSLEDPEQGWGDVGANVKAIVDYYGPTNFLIMDNLPDDPPGICENAMVHLSANSPESRLLGCDIRYCPEKVKFADPITYISSDDPPYLIFHGTSDCVVTPESSIILQRALSDNNIRAVLHLMPGAGHGGPEFSDPEIKSKVLDFLDNILK